MIAIKEHTFFTVLGIVGALWISNFVLKIFHFVWIHFLRRSSITRYRHNHHSSSASPWAIVTGSSDGIGRAYAYELANLGFNVVLHGRNSSKLHHVRHDLQVEYPHLQFRILVLDASFSGPQATKSMIDAVETLKDLHITILINNVGTGQKHDGPVLQSFTETTSADVDLLMNINARFPLQFTHAVLPLLLSHGGPALIITMGSIAEIGMPFLATYASLKSVDLAFSRALRRDIRAQGRDNVEVIGMMTAGVTDVEWDRSPKDLSRPSSGEYAKKALEMVGSGEEVVAPWWSHALIWEAMKCLPTWIVDLALANGTRRVIERTELAKKI
ncbi:hypothetical protein EG329_010627 [Mollisiaceae sp. DMI_Dod_QoI]|nr:hypothetical protein EG329_010627 [Helotiales sp. DMI_Dod_QoI]